MANPRTTAPAPLFRLSLLCLPLLLLLGLAPPAGAGNRFSNVSGLRTEAALEELACIAPDELDKARELVKALDYNGSRVVRAFAVMPGANFQQLQDLIAVIIRKRLSFEQVLAFESWSYLNRARPADAAGALARIQAMDLRTARTFRAYCATIGARADVAIGIISPLLAMRVEQDLAARAFFQLPDAHAGASLAALQRIARMSTMQSWAVESFCKVKGMDEDKATRALPLIERLRRLDAWNAHKLFRARDMEAQRAWYWLISWLAQPLAQQEAGYLALDSSRKSQLLEAMHRGGYLVCSWINDLHDVTDEVGREIPDRVLHGMSIEEIMKIFRRLTPPTWATYGHRAVALAGQGRRAALIQLLETATAADRRQVARDCTSANIYALLAQGSELYDSSFRDILVPILRQRIEENWPGGLLDFLADIDPANMLTSDFVVSLAQKGKLTVFFPQDMEGQRRVLDLVAKSAFADQQSLILFAATFARLLEVLDSGARSYLIDQMADEVTWGQGMFSRQVLAILQYYMEEFPKLLSGPDKVRIAGLVVRHGGVDLDKYQRTPFAEWKEDGRLRSLSLFHPDDDGRDSFVSNALGLMRHGYRPRLSTSFAQKTLDEAGKRQARSAVAAIRGRSAASLERLFDQMLAMGFCLDFVGHVKGIEIVHSVAVYGGEEAQANLLLQFLRGGCEMFAQRGHSYWRQEQLIQPMLKMIANRVITDADLSAKQRFLSLGSCGGLRVYSQLMDLFDGRVDILATVGTGTAVINDPYNRGFFEIIAKSPDSITWKDLSRKAAGIFGGTKGRDYLQPGSLPAILHKMLYEKGIRVRALEVLDAATQDFEARP